MIDTHLHLIYPEHFKYSWTDGIAELQGGFSLSDYKALIGNSGIQGALFMEVDVDEGYQHLEAGFFSDLAKDPDCMIRGAIAAVRPEIEGFRFPLEKLSQMGVRGVRRVLHTQPDELSQSKLFRQNVAMLGEFNLTFDICMLQRQLPLALELVQQCPQTPFILDHCGVPDIAANDAPHGEGWLDWVASIQALSKEPNLHCKLSGITVYAKPEQRNTKDLKPYFEVLLESFGANRVVWGSDWPVCNLADGLPKWLEITHDLLRSLNAEEKQAIMTTNARRIYRI